MLKGHLIFTVQRFGYGAGYGYKSPQTVIAEIRTVGRINTDRGRSPPPGYNKSAALLRRVAFPGIQTTVSSAA